MTNMHDSGNRQSFETGAVRDTADGKTRPDLISPFALQRLGHWLRLGAMKYKERNWESGIPISRCIASLDRHFLDYQAGCTKEDHLAAILCNTMFVMHYEHEIEACRLPESLNDMPFYEQQTPPAPSPMSLAEVEQIDPSLMYRSDNTVDPYPHPIEPKWHVLPQLKDKIIPVCTRYPTLYIAGPMRGKPGLNWMAFDNAAKELREAGYNVINPAYEDRCRGINPKDYENTTDPDDTNEIDPDLLREIVRDDLDIVQSLQPVYGDGIALLKGWEWSSGAAAEHAVAYWLDIPRKTVGEWLAKANFTGE